jgi:hypothetical protein
MGKLVSASSRRSVWVLSTLAPLILVGFAAGANASPSYTVTDLGPGQPYAINNNGQVVGYNGANAFMYSGGIALVLRDATADIASGPHRSLRS